MTSGAESLSIRHGKKSTARKLAWGTGLVLALTLGVLPSSSAGAVGTTPNSISVGPAPSEASPHGAYDPKATATSGDVVKVTLDKNSSGCALGGSIVTFTGAGECLVDFNDPGNENYAPAAQVTQSIKVFAANSITTSTLPKAGSTGGRFAPGASATSGDKVLITLDPSSSGCSMSGVWVDFTGPGYCKVDFNDPGAGSFGPADQVQKSVKVYASNEIDVRPSPSAGAIHATYTPVASATSGDVVAISLDGASTGCSLSHGQVTFTDNGVCVIDFNDPGNGAFAAAAEVKRSITVGYGNPAPQSPLAITSVSVPYGRTLILTTEGGSGYGAVTYTVASAGSADCSIDGDVLSSRHAGTCVVVATKAAYQTYLAATSPAATITVTALAPRALRVSSVLWVGRTSTIRVIGARFYGRPLVASNLLGVSAVVVRDTGRVLTLRVRVGHGSRRGWHRMTIIFPHGQRTRVSYLVR